MITFLPSYVKTDINMLLEISYLISILAIDKGFHSLNILVDEYKTVYFEFYFQYTEIFEI